MLYDPNRKDFVPWQPSTWPASPSQWSDEFEKYFQAIIKGAIIDELDNGINDILRSNGSLLHRGHVVGIALLCAVDTVSSYAYHTVIKPPCPKCGRGDKVGPKYTTFISNHFPAEYKPYAEELYGLYRNSLVHSWHLFRAALLPGIEPIKKDGNSISFGLLNLHQAIKSAISDFFTTLHQEPGLQQSVINRYVQLKSSATN